MKDSDLAPFIFYLVMLLLFGVIPLIATLLWAILR